MLSFLLCSCLISSLSFILPHPMHLCLFCVATPTYYFSPELSLVMSLSATSCRHTSTCTQWHVFLHMHRYGSHQCKVKGLPHYPAPVKTFGKFYAGIREQREGSEGKKRGKKGY